MPHPERNDGDSREQTGTGLSQEHDEPGQIEQERPDETREAHALDVEEPEAEAQRCVGKEGERIPVSDRALQAGDTAHVVGPERRDRLPEERPRERPSDDRGGEQCNRTEAVAGKGAGREADDTEREDRDPLADGIQRAVARD